MKDELFEYHKVKREAIKSQYDRVLPFNEEFTNRWEKAEFLGFGENTSVYDSAVVMGKVVVGEDTWIGPYTLLDGTGGGLYIGSGCNISAGVQIYTHDTVKACLTGNKTQKQVGSVRLGDNTYVGPMSVISKGVTIGKRCVIGTNSFVNKSFGDNCIIAGTPARQIGRVMIDAEGNAELNYEI